MMKWNDEMKKSFFRKVESLTRGFSFPIGSSNKIEGSVKGTRSNEAQPNYHRQGLSCYLLQIARPTSVPSQPRSLSTWKNQLHNHEQSLFIGNRSYSNPSKVLPSARTDGNFFFWPVDDHGPAKKFILHRTGPFYLSLILEEKVWLRATRY